MLYRYLCEQKCLDNNPDKRWTAGELVSHAYFNGFTFRLPPEETGSVSPSPGSRDRRKVRANAANMNR